MCCAGTIQSVGMEMGMKIGAGPASGSDPKLISLCVIKSRKRKELSISTCSHTYTHTAAETGCWISSHAQL